VESCARRISWDPVGFHECGFMSVSTVVIIGDGCCSSASVPWGLSTMTSCLSTIKSSTMTSFAQLW
jgi:hypothetical protein